MYCSFVGGRCSKCGYTLKSWMGDGVLRECGVGKGLGDRLEYELTRMGITQDRYKEIKEKFGFPPTCGCEKRKQWLNKVGVYLGIGR